MAQKPDDQYEYKVCSKCAESKKVHKDNEPLWYWEEWIQADKKMCLCCTREIMNEKLGITIDRRYDKNGVLELTLSDWYMMYKESARPK